MKAGVDFMIENHGSVALVVITSGFCSEWVDEHVPLEPWQWIRNEVGAYNAFVVEPRYLEDLVNGMLAAEEVPVELKPEDVKVEQVWKDLDPREPFRRVKVIAIEGDRAVVQAGRKTKIKLARLVKHFKLIEG